MSKEKEKSIVKSKNSTLRLADFIAESGVSLVPGGTPVYKLSKILLSHTVKYFNDRREKRLEEFYKKLLEGVEPECLDDFLNKDISEEEYYSFLKQVIQDDEDKKVEIYAKIFKGFLLDLLPNCYKLHIIKSIQEMQYSDFELLRLVYINELLFINEQSRINVPGNKLNQIKALTQPKEPIRIYSIQTLIRLGYLYEKDGTKPPWPTELTKIIVEYLFDKNALTVQSI